MDKCLKPERFDALPNTPGSDKAWLHWKKAFDNFLASMEDPDKLKLLINFVSAVIFEFISDCNNYDTATTTLESLYLPPKNELLSRHLLTTRCQQSSEALDAYLNALRLSAKDCNFRAVTAEVYKQEMIRDSFMVSHLITYGNSS